MDVYLQSMDEHGMSIFQFKNPTVIFLKSQLSQINMPITYIKGDTRCLQIGDLGSWVCSHPVNLKSNKILSQILHLQTGIETKHFSQAVLQFQFHYLVLSFPAKKDFIRLINLLPSKTIHPF